MKDYYQILGLTESATADEIKKAYRKLAMQHHPDRDTGNEAKFKEINEANDTLSDPAKKAKYDQQRKFGQGSAFNFGRGGFNERDQFEDVLRQHFGSGAEDIMDSMFGFRRRTRTRQQVKNRDILLRVELEAKDLLNPVIKTLNYKTTKGTERTVEVHTPNSLKDQQRVVMHEMGDDAIKDKPPGNLIVEFSVTMPKGFELGMNGILHSKLNIPLWTALLGGSARFKNYDDTELDVKIYAGVPNGRLFVLKEKGVKISDQFRGDLILEACIDIPFNLTEEQKELVRQIQAIESNGE